MEDVLEEVVSDSIDKNHVIRRLDEWISRLNSLYDCVESWLPAGWSADRHKTKLMHEDMMKRFDLMAREVPILELNSDNGRHAKIEPRALWIIGANGRVDLFADNGHFLIIDRAKNFGVPEWQIVNFHKRDEVSKLDQARFVAALS